MGGSEVDCSRARRRSVALENVVVDLDGQLGLISPPLLRNQEKKDLVMATESRIYMLNARFGGGVARVYRHAVLMGGSVESLPSLDGFVDRHRNAVGRDLCVDSDRNQSVGSEQLHFSLTLTNGGSCNAPHTQSESQDLG